MESAVAPDATIVYPSVEKNESFRDAVHRFTAVSPWYSFGIDLLLGAEADAPQDARRLQFIPSVLMGDFESATIVQGDSARRLVDAVEVLVEEDRLPATISFFNKSKPAFFIKLTEK